MKRILHIISSPREDESRTLQVSEVFLEAFQKKHPDWVVDELNLFKENLPSLSQKNVSGKYVLLEGKDLFGSLKESWAEILQHIERFKAADFFLISTPMWNFSIPYALKQYIDIIVQPKHLFRYKENGEVEGLVKDKKMVIITSRGGQYSNNPKMNHQEPYLRTIFNFVGIQDIEFIVAEPMDQGPEMREQKLEEAKKTMPRDVPVGNGNILVAYDLQGLIREFHFPHVGEENHTLGRPFRFGLWVDGQFSWLSCTERMYMEETLVTDLIFQNFGVKIQCQDLVDFEDDIYLRKIIVENFSNQVKEVRLFLCHDFSIYGNAIGDTAAYFPENKSLFHYKGDRYFLINILANQMYGIDRYATGDKNVWKDAEDGVLSGNPIAQGSVGSCFAISLQLPSHGKETCYSWIAAATEWDQAKLLNEIVRKKTPEVLFKRTGDFWKFWMNKGECKSQLSDRVRALYRRSLAICKTQINSFGSIIASNDSDAINFNQDTYSYMWPRDGALVANAFDLAGYEMHKFYKFCASILENEGYFLHKYTPTGSLASSWLPWVKEKRAQLPIQEDETALVIWALWKHYEIYKDLEFIRTLYSPLIKKCANFMMNYRDRKTGLPLPSYDLWEEREGVLTFTVSTVYGGLMAAANFTEMFGEKELADEYREGAKKMREAMDKYLYLPDKKRFARMVNFNKGSVVIDDTLDASIYATFTFGAYDATDERVKNSMEQVINELSSGGGIARYKNDAYYRQGDQGNPWFICTLWVAQYYIAIGEKEKARGILEWVVDHALPSGVLAEQISATTGEPLSVSPLTWSHGAFIATVEQFCRK